MRNFEDLSLKEKLGQLLVFGFEGTKVTPEVIDFVKEYKAGNIILFARNLEDVEQSKKLNQDLRELIYKETGIYPFISLDQEGGVVSRLPEGAVIFPSAMAISATGDPENARLASYYTALELRALGFNVNYAPVLDVNNNPKNPVIGVRSYGSSADRVIAYANPAFKGYLEGDILAVAKHFPGHGDTDVDSHLGLPKVEKSKEELYNLEIKPFKAAIAEGLTGIMNAHILYPSFESAELPATLSKKIMQGLERDELGFEGLIFSDCMQMQAISEHYGTERAFYMGIEAGLDQVLISHSPKIARDALELAEEAVKAGKLSMQRVDASVKRVLAFKEKYAAQASRAIEPEELAKASRLSKDLSKKAISRVDNNKDFPKVNKETFFISTLAERSTFVSSNPANKLSLAEYLAKGFKAEYELISTKPDAERQAEVLNAAKEHKLVVLATYNAHLNTEQIDLAKKLLAAGHEVIMIAMRNPYDLALVPERVYKLAAFDYSLNTFAAIMDIMQGEKAQGEFKF